MHGPIELPPFYALKIMVEKQMRKHLAVHHASGKQSDGKARKNALRHAALFPRCRDDISVAHIKLLGNRLIPSRSRLTGAAMSPAARGNGLDQMPLADARRADREHVAVLRRRPRSLIGSRSATCCPGPVRCVGPDLLPHGLSNKLVSSFSVSLASVMSMITRSGVAANVVVCLVATLMPSNSL